MCRKTELLAPAGSFAILKAAIEAGADAVYAAGDKFGARAYAKNFTEEEMLAAIDYAHIRGKQLYLTVNTLLKEREIRALYDYLCPLYEAGLDAVIVQDIGVMHFIRKHFPDLPIHASTQMTVTGTYGAKLLMEHGCSRIVTARELSLAEISHIYRTTGAEIESFIHGALCYCYSGQCLMSSMIGGRSGNRGRCAQPCRLPYELQKEPRGLSVPKRREKYPLSLKDLCAIEMIPELIQSGIHSFKIEGRMKQEAYVAGVTAIYRKYLDLYENYPSGDYRVSSEDYQKLLDLGNRSGFTDGYYKRHNGRDMVTFHKPSHEKNSDALQTGPVIHSEIPKTKEKINGILRIFINNPASLVVEYKGIKAEAVGFTVQAAEKQPLGREAVLERMRKTGNTPFEFEKLQIEMEQGSFVPAGALNQLRRDAIDKLTELILKKYQRTAPEWKAESAQSDKSVNKQREPLLRLSVLTETLEQFETVLAQPEVERIYQESFAFQRAKLCEEMKELAGQAHAEGKTCFLALPHIFRRQTAEWYAENWRQISVTEVDGYLVRNLEELSFLLEMGVPSSQIQGDSNLYVTSNEAVCGWQMLSLCHYTLPVELNGKELQKLNCAGGEMILYGYQPMMLSAQCLHKTMKGCGKTESVFYLKDRYGKLFPVKNHCEDCYNMIYNVSPLSLLHQLREIQLLHPEGIRLCFTIEDRAETEHIFEYYRQAKAGKLNRDNYLKDFTNGHFKRGVE